MDESCYDVVVIGGGASGLNAAYTVLKNDPKARFVVLEAAERLGGRLCSAVLKGPDGNTGEFDLGGHWISRTQPNVSTLVKELGLETVWHDAKGDKLLIDCDGTLKRFRDTLTGGLSMLGALDAYLVISKIEKFSKLVPAHDYTECQYSKAWDGATLETFKQHSMITKEGKAVFDYAVEALFGAEPSQMSLLYFLHYCKIAGGFEQLTDLSKPGNAQEQSLKGGAYQIIKSLAEKVGSANIKMNSPVISLIQDEEQVTVTVANGAKYKAKFVIVSAPVHCKAKIKYDPPLPMQQADLFQRMPIGKAIKFIATYQTKFWKEKGLSGEMMHLPGDVANAVVVDMMFDSSTHNGVPALVGFIFCQHQYRFGNLKESDRKEAIIAFLVRCFGEEAKNVIDFVIKDWSKERTVGGCPVGVASPGTYTIFDEENLRTPFDKIHWAGTETATLWRGYIDGAIQSGTRAAFEVLTRLKDGFVVPTMFSIRDLSLKEQRRETSLFSSFRRKQK